MGAVSARAGVVQGVVLAIVSAVVLALLLGLPTLAVIPDIADTGSSYGGYRTYGGYGLAAETAAKRRSQTPSLRQRTKRL